MVLSKLKAAPAALRERLPGGGAPDLPGPDLADVVPDPSSDMPAAVPTPSLPSRDDLPETSTRDKLMLGLTLLSVVGALLAVVAAVARIVVERRWRAEREIEIEVVEEGDEETAAERTAAPEYPKIAPLVGMAALVGMRLFVQRLGGDSKTE